MYSNIRSVQILISLLKEFDIRDIVLSPGGSDIPLIHSIETDIFFHCYSVVDERSAAYYAMGVAQTKNRPVACVCTSGTAVCNYVPGITEAYYQSVPVLAITADKNPYYQDQLEIQKIDQNHIFTGVVKKSVELPLIKDEEDEWLCNRLVNEALLALTHHGTGPVQINVPIVGRTNVYDCEKLPLERKMNLVEMPINNSTWEKYAQKLVDKKVMVVVGQNIVFSKADIEHMNVFFNKYDCIYSVEHLSNLECDGVVHTYPLTEMSNFEAMDCLKSDIVISIGNNLAAYMLKPFLRANYKTINNWLVNESGNVRDAYKCLTTIFECSPSEFFKNIANVAVTIKDSNHGYYNMWQEQIKKIKLPDFTFSNFYVAQQLSKVIPENSLLHLAILNSTRIMQFFPLAKGVKTYSNVGALGIDGCFSTFAGQAAATESLSFLVVGDLSFFYDMNAAGLRSINSNVRVIMLNNGGGSEFHFFMGKRNISTINDYICAEHGKVAEGWIKSLGYDYYSAKTKEELNAVIDKFGKPSDRPMLLEVFTEMEEDADRTNEMYDVYRKQGQATTYSMKNTVKSIFSEKQLNKAKKIWHTLKEG